MLGDWRFLYFLFVCAVNLTLSLTVFLKDRHSTVNRFFSLSVFSVALWTFTNALLHASPPGTSALYWGRLTFAAASLIPGNFLAFAEAFPPSTTRVSRAHFLASLGLAAGFALLACTPWIVNAVTYDQHGLRLLYGPAYPLFAMYFASCFSLSLGLLWHKHRFASGLDRLRLRYLLLGSLLGVAGGASTNLLIPLLFNTSRFSWLGPAFSVVAFAFIAHAILRYRLMDIRIVLSKGLSYVAALVITSVSSFALLVLLQARPASLPPDNLLLLSFSVALLAAIMFHPLFLTAEALLSRYAYRPLYDQHHALRDAAAKISAPIQRALLYDYLRAIIHKTLRPESLALYGAEGNAFSLIFHHRDNISLTLPPPPLLPASELASLVKRLSEPLLSAEAALRSTAAAHDLLRLRWDLIVPITRTLEPIAFLALGPKLSADPYYPSDIQFLVALSHQVGMALHNSDLYERVRSVNEHLENVLKNMESGVIAINETGTITTANAASGSILDLRTPALLGRPVEVLPLPLAQALRSTLTGQLPVLQSETLLRDASNSVRHIVFSTSILKTASNAPLGALLVFSDHTQMRELERERHRAERLAAFQSMAAGIAHEIKNPLVAIKTFAELLPERFSDSDFRDGFSVVVAREIERISSLVDRLRGIAHSTTEGMGPVSLHAALEETLSLVRPRLELSSIIASYTSDTKTPSVIGNHAQLKQLFLNLFLNAIEAIDQRGSLDIRLTTRAHPDRAVLVIITDSGPGIPQAIAGQVFDPFVTTKPYGSGLGLSICRGIADAHHASIRAQSATGHPGTTVTIEFPLADDAILDIPRSTSPHSSDHYQADTPVY